MNEVLRQEKKYAVNLADAAVLRGRLGQVMHPDAHNGPQGYVIRSLYFDTPDDQDFHDKLDGLELRRKIRLRAYGPGADFAMLEMKQKEGPYQRKRSLRVSRADAARLCRGDYRPLEGYGEPFAAECYALMHCRCYRPKAVVEYRRQAYVARENRRPWLVTAALAAVFLVLTFLKPPGQELFAILWGNAGGLAAGALVFGLIARVRR